MHAIVTSSTKPESASAVPIRRHINACTLVFEEDLISMVIVNPRENHDGSGFTKMLLS